jgi:hypothetical protein
MRVPNSGITTIECLVAITVFSLGALGAAGTITFGIRAAASGTRLGTATRIAAEVFESAQYQLQTRQQSCAVLAPGRRTGPGGEVVDWAVAPVARGARLVVTLTYMTPVGQHGDSVVEFLRCH